MGIASQMLATALRIEKYVRSNGLLPLVLRVVELIYERSATFVWTLVFHFKCLLMGVKEGHKLEVFGNCIIRKHPQSRIVIGDHVQLISSSWRSSTANCFNCKLVTINKGAAITFGDHSGMTGGVMVARSKTITIGARCMLAPNVTIVDSDFHVTWPPERRHNALETDIERDRGVTLEENVWVGMGCIILKGVTIGKNSVISAGSVVTQSIPPNCIAGGNPAKVVKCLDKADS
jgi:acetyltransferase-like isoleucine patch superfamily enzyme